VQPDTVGLEKITAEPVDRADPGSFSVTYRIETRPDAGSVSGKPAKQLGTPMRLGAAGQTRNPLLAGLVPATSIAGPSTGTGASDL
jgi:hypothetical protein